MKYRRNSHASFGPRLESMESRCMLSAVVGPVFNTPLPDAYWISDTAATKASLNTMLSNFKVMPNAVAGGLQFRGAAGWTGSAFSLTASTGDTFGVAVTGSDVAVTIVDGVTQWQDIVTALNANTDFQSLGITSALSGADGNASAIDTTSLTPWGSGLKLTAGTSAGSMTLTIVAATGETPTAGVTVTGVNVTVAIVPGTTTWQNVADLLNASTDFTALKLTASVAGPDGQVGQPTALASLLTQVTYNPSPVLTWTAGTVGAAGNVFTVTIKDGTALDAAVTGNDIVVTINTGTTTLQDIITEVQSLSAFTDLGISTSVLGGSTALASASAVTHFTGGADMIPGSRTIGIDGYEAGNGALTIKVTTDRPDVLNIGVPDGTIDANGVIHETDPFAKLHFVDSTGKAIGDIYSQIFLNDPASNAAAQRFIDLATKGVKSTAASLLIKPDASKADGLLFTAGIKGPDANNVTITIVDGTALSVAVTGTNAVITINTGSTRLQDIITALSSNSDFLQLYVAVTLKGTSVLAKAAPETNLTGGSGTLVKGTPFYSNVVVHRVIPNFMIQTGDKLGGDGSGYSGLGNIADAYDPNLTYGGEGVFGMANTGQPDTSDCQFFITQDAYTYGNGSYMIFGQMISGSSVLNSIINLPTGQNATHSAQDYPNNPPYLQSVTMSTSNQDGSFILTPTSDFTGVAHVTITLTDAAGHTTSKTILVTTQDALGSAPTVTPIDNQTVTPGSHTPISAVATDDHGFTVKYDVQVTDPKMKPFVTVSQNGIITIDTPATYSGVYSVTVTATEIGIPGSWVDTNGNGVQDAGDTDVGTGVLSADSKGFAERSAGQTSFRVYSLASTEKWGQTGDNANAVAVLNNTMYEALGSSGLKIYDITDPANPRLMGSYQKLDASGQPATDTYGRAVLQYRDVKVIQQVVNGQTIPVVYATNQQGGVDILGVTVDPSDATKVTVALLSNINGGTASEETSYSDQRPYSIATILHGDYAVVPGMNQLKFYNISNPAHPGNPVSVPLPYGLAFNAAANVVFNGTTMYVADLAGTVYMFNVSNMLKPTLVTYFRTAGEPWGMDVQNNRLYVADLVKGLLVYDISSGHSAKKLGQYTPSTTAYDVVVKNQEAFLFTADSTISLLVNNPAKMSVEDTFATVGSASPVLDANNKLYLPAGSGFSSMDVSNLMDRRVASPGAATSFLDELGHTVTVSAVNARVNIILSGLGEGEIEKIDVIPLKAGGSVTITVAGGWHTQTNEVAIEGSLGLGSFTASALDLNGDFVVGGSQTDKAIGAISLGNVLAGHTLTVNGTGTGFSFKAGNVQDFTINSAHTAVTSVTVNSWTDSTYLDPTADINTIAVGKITSAGDFGADMELTGYGSATKTVLGPVSISGYLQGATWDVDGAVGNITATKGVKDSRVQSTGSMGLLTLGSAQAADFLAGMTTSDRHATAGSQFNTLTSIKGVTIKGFSGMTQGQALLTDSNFSAATIGASTLLNVDTSNGDDFGLFALTNSKKTQLNSVKLGQLDQFGKKVVYSPTWVSSKDPDGSYRDGQLVLSSIQP